MHTLEGRRLSTDESELTRSGHDQSFKDSTVSSSLIQNQAITHDILKYIKNRLGFTFIP